MSIKQILDADYKVPADVFQDILMALIEVQALNERVPHVFSLSSDTKAHIDYIIPFMEERINARFNRAKYKSKQRY